VVGVIVVGVVVVVVVVVVVLVVVVVVITVVVVKKWLGNELEAGHRNTGGHCFQPVQSKNIRSCSTNAAQIYSIARHVGMCRSGGKNSISLLDGGNWSVSRPDRCTPSPQYLLYPAI